MFFTFFFALAKESLTESLLESEIFFFWMLSQTNPQNVEHCMFANVSFLF